ncbi:hypothetical protein NIES4101_55150 [Calothrix sp. NIES-4101]|nr:hypothetical protein NIES4101_55150 [Calothrix sp. NIES-4101]
MRLLLVISSVILLLLIFFVVFPLIKKIVKKITGKEINFNPGVSILMFFIIYMIILCVLSQIYLIISGEVDLVNVRTSFFSDRVNSSNTDNYSNFISQVKLSLNYNTTGFISMVAMILLFSKFMYSKIKIIRKNIKTKLIFITFIILWLCSVPSSIIEGYEKELRISENSVVLNMFNKRRVGKTYSDNIRGSEECYSINSKYDSNNFDDLSCENTAQLCQKMRNLGEQDVQSENIEKLKDVQSSCHSHGW